MIQQVLIILIFSGAAIYLGRLAYRSFQTKNTCDAGCGKCGVDMHKIEEELKTKGFS